MTEIKLYFCLVRKKRNKKTREWVVRKNSHYALAERLGMIKWFGRWRQYVFIPDQNTVWSSGCLTQISEFLIGCNVAYRERWKHG